MDLDKGPSSLQSFDLGTPVGTAADIGGSKNEIIVGAKHGYAVMNRDTKELEYIKKVWEVADGPEKGERMRFNDGVVDHEGRYWAGTMNDPKVRSDFQAEGVLFRLEPDLTLHPMIEKVTIPNGMGFSIDEKTVYFTDTPTGNVFKFNYDHKTGDISDREVFYHHEGEDSPDGLAMDLKGYVWIAICGVSKVRQVSPEGKLVGKISLPTRMITCPAFAREDMFITSAEEEETEKYPESARYGGSLFRVNVGIGALPLYKFRKQ